MFGWHHQLEGHEFEQTLGVGDEQGGLACCSPWGCNESDTTGHLNGTESTLILICFIYGFLCYTKPFRFNQFLFVFFFFFFPLL